MLRCTMCSAFDKPALKPWMCGPKAKHFELLCWCRVIVELSCWCRVIVECCAGVVWLLNVLLVLCDCWIGKLLTLINIKCGEGTQWTTWTVKKSESSLGVFNALGERWGFTVPGILRVLEFFCCSNITWNCYQESFEQHPYVYVWYLEDLCINCWT